MLSVSYDSLCSEIREAWAIDASNGLQIYPAFPEAARDRGTSPPSATLSRDAEKVFQSVMSVW